MVVRGLVEKPARIDTPLGTLADVGNYFTPKLSRRVLHQLYLGYPDSAAARGIEAAEPSSAPSRRPRRPVTGGGQGAGAAPGQARGSAGAWRALVADRHRSRVTPCRSPSSQTSTRVWTTRWRWPTCSAAPMPSSSASPPPREMFRCNRFAKTTWACWSCAGVEDVPVSKGSEQPVSSPLRTAEDTHGPQGLGYATLPSTDRAAHRARRRAGVDHGRARISR